MRDECEHGSLRRSCEICERDTELAALRARIAAATAECERIERDYYRCDGGHGADVARAIRAKLENG